MQEVVRRKKASNKYILFWKDGTLHMLHLNVYSLLQQAVMWTMQKDCQLALIQICENSIYGHDATYCVLVYTSLW